MLGHSALGQAALGQGSNPPTVNTLDTLPGALMLSAAAAGLLRKYTISSAAGSIMIASGAARLGHGSAYYLTFGGSINKVQTWIYGGAAQDYAYGVENGAFALTGYNATMRRVVTLNAQAGVLRIGTQQSMGALGEFALGQASAVAPQVSFTLRPRVVSAVGAFTIQGYPVTFSRPRILTATASALTLTSHAVTLTFTRAVIALAASYSLAGVDVTWHKPVRVINTQTKALTISGQGALGLRSLRIAATASSLALTSHAVTLTLTRAVVALVGAYSVAGVGVTPKWSHKLTAVSQAFTLQGYAQALLHHRFTQTAAGALTITQHPVRETYTRAIVAASAALHLSGVSVRALWFHKLVANPRAQWVLAGKRQALIRIRTPLRTMTAASYIFHWTGRAVTFRQNRVLGAAPGALSLAGVNTRLSVYQLLAYRLTALSGALAITAQAAQAHRNYVMSVTTGTMLLAPQSTASIGVHILRAAPSAFALAGVAVNLAHARQPTTSAGSLAIAGQTAQLSYNRKLVAAAAALTLSGVNSRLTWNRQVQAAGTAFAISGVAQVMTRSRIGVAAPGALVIAGAVQFIRKYIAQTAAGSFAIQSYPINTIRTVMPTILAVLGDNRLITGYDASLRYDRIAPLDPSAYGIAGNTVTMRRNRVMQVATGGLGIAGQSVGLLTTKQLHATFGVFSLVPNPAVVAFVRSLQAATGALAIASQNATVARKLTLMAAPASFSVASQPATPSWNHQLSAVAGAMTIHGSALGNPLDKPADVFGWVEHTAVRDCSVGLTTEVNTELLNASITVDFTV